MRCLSDGELDRVGRGGDERRDCAWNIFDAGEKRAFIEESVVECDIEAAAGGGMEEAVEAGGFHAEDAAWREAGSRKKIRNTTMTATAPQAGASQMARQSWATPSTGAASVWAARTRPASCVPT